MTFGQLWSIELLYSPSLIHAATFSYATIVFCLIESRNDPQSVLFWRLSCFSELEQPRGRAFDLFEPALAGKKRSCPSKRLFSLRKTRKSTRKRTDWGEIWISIKQDILLHFWASLAIHSVTLDPRDPTDSRGINQDAHKVQNGLRGHHSLYVIWFEFWRH